MLPDRDDEPLGLRERKRATARARVEQVAVDLCLEHGYGSVTVAQICAAAGIAQSTFFTYFGSKDAAILGRPPVPSPEAVDAFVEADGPLLGDLLTLLTVGARDAVSDLALFRRRFELVDSDARLRAREARRAEVAPWQADVVARRLRRRGDLTAAEIAEQAQMAAGLALSILRHTFWSVRTAPGTEWNDRLRRSHSLARALLQGSPQSAPRGAAASRASRPGAGGGTRPRSG
ncbi:TetR/AcrR family transcriptional regulator [Cellulomonas wangsupingiae]|uniref:TetR/AcrR family transcriptional regulator n=1 Tax=Cellulomonas wangsupingiae TaxID=2968085 RepID=A0ABY5K3B3_9CELL|nr:TetR/AcrR family transcriptional regulator [Cellulomonas wangsupingiae]MCC2336098.1 TetR/AcrR family transcriptional regulator [Cellulomonas wangsupingiae]MCM0639590.1 TetR/AcrR family transcriptional regulator [Cellulomonas wangsupingiae]UUI64820.1 TetR/AcrR family transcriptional regulator [Cellulomonas wangsupingiae]